MTQSIFHEAKSEGPLYALFLLCTLKKSPTPSNTEALCNLLIERLKAHEPTIETEIVRVVDYNILPGIENDEGVAQRIIERLDGTTHTVMCERTGQFPLYGSACGIVVTGNEDGSHDCVANTFANLLHFGVTVPPNTDLYWVGDAGPGASYIDAGGELSPYVRRNAELTAQNLLFAAKLLRDNPYPINIAQQNKTMMERNQVKMAAMQQAIQYMRDHMK